MAFNIPSPSIGEVFRSSYPFYVPMYQRGYAWESEEVADFIKDINNLVVDPSEPPHFMGGMVHVHHPAANVVSRKLEIVDGQQRMATFTLAVSAVVKGLAFLHDHSSDDDIKGACKAQSDEIHEAVLSYKEIEGARRVDRPKLTLSRTDEPYFRGLLNNAAPAESRESHRRLGYAYTSLYLKLIEPILTDSQTEDEKLEKLVELYQTISKRCEVIHIITDSHQEAYRLYSVMNDRGCTLTAGDLLRARTLEILEADITIQREVEQRWDDILDGTADDTDKYLKAFYPSVAGIRAPHNSLFDTYQGKFLTPPTANAARDMVSKLAWDKPVFTAIRQGIWPFSQNSIATDWDRDRLHRLVNVLRHEAAHPVLLSAIGLGEKKFIDVVRLLERFVFRYITIVGAHPSPLYNPYYTQAKRMHDARSTYNVRDLKRELATLIATRAPDSAFGGNLPNKLQYSDNTVRNREIKHFLSTLESYRRWYERLPVNRSKLSPDTMLLIDVNAGTLEHIYPDNAPSVQQDTAMELLKQRLGNLTIMASNDNQVIGNQPFAQKKVEYARSSIGLTRNLGQLVAWTQTELEARERDLIAMALAVFDFT